MLIKHAKSLSDVMDALTSLKLPDHRRRDIISAIGCIGTMIGRGRLQDIPVTPPELRALVSEIRPAAHGIKRKTLANQLSLLNSALLLTGYIEPTHRGLAAKNEAWKTLLEHSSADRAVSIGLAAFANWCVAHGVHPEEVSDETLTAYLHWLTTRTLHLDPRLPVRRIPALWNRLKQAGLGHLIPISFKTPQRHRRWDQLDAKFREDAECYLTARASLDLFDDGPNASRRPLATDTLRLHKDQIRIAASLLMDAGESPSSLADLISEAHFKLIIRSYFCRDDLKPNAFATNMAGTLLRIARAHVLVDTDHFAALKKFTRAMPRLRRELTEKNKRLLALLKSDECRARLLFLPERLFADVVRAWDAGERPYVDAEIAIAIAILLVASLRPQNLSPLHWGRHFSKLDRSKPLLLQIPAPETKTGQDDIIAEIPDDVARMIDWYRRNVLPYLGGSPDGHLFIAEGGRLKDQKTLAGQIIDALDRHVGVHMTPHQFRHFNGASYLDEHPGEIETVRAHLGHASVKTTMIYVGSSSHRSSRAYGEHLMAQRNLLKIKARVQKRSARKPKGKLS
jgi:integrase